MGAYTSTRVKKNHRIANVSAPLCRFRFSIDVLPPKDSDLGDEEEEPDDLEPQSTARPPNFFIDSKLFRTACFFSSLLLLLHPSAAAFLAAPETLKLYGAFLLGLSVCLLFAASEEGGEGQSAMGQRKARRRQKGGVPKEDEVNIKEVRIKDVMKSIDVIEAMRSEYQWIQAGRLLAGCRRAVEAAGAGSAVASETAGKLDTPEMKDVMER